MVRSRRSSSPTGQPSRHEWVSRAAISSVIGETEDAKSGTSTLGGRVDEGSAVAVLVEVAVMVEAATTVVGTAVVEVALDVVDVEVLREVEDVIVDATDVSVAVVEVVKGVPELGIPSEVEADPPQATRNVTAQRTNPKDSDVADARLVMFERPVEFWCAVSS
jgi:hypothetical protein